MSLKDLNQSANIDKLIEAGVTSFKIEGRLKDVTYVKNVTSFYNNVLNNFTINPFTGITSWLMPFGQGKTQYLGLFPTSSTNADTTKLTKEVLSTDTTIEVESTKGFIRNFGRVKIGAETILYQNCDDTKLYGCV